LHGPGLMGHRVFYSMLFVLHIVICLFGFDFHGNSMLKFCKTICSPKWPCQQTIRLLNWNPFKLWLRILPCQNVGGSQWSEIEFERTGNPTKQTISIMAWQITTILSNFFCKLQMERWEPAT
jgi:hypothetical protein